MRREKFWFTMSGILAVLPMALMLPPEVLAASKFHVLYRFTFHDGGVSPTSLTLDAAGNLYGTLLESSADTGGTVFKLTPNSQGGWTESTLYAFCSLANCADGRDPGGPLVFDGAGNLYGTTQFGGDSSCQPPYGCGTVSNSSRTRSEAGRRAFCMASPVAPTESNLSSALHSTTPGICTAQR